MNYDHASTNERTPTTTTTNDIKRVLIDALSLLTTFVSAGTKPFKNNKARREVKERR